MGRVQTTLLNGVSFKLALFTFVTAFVMNLNIVFAQQNEGSSHVLVVNNHFPDSVSNLDQTHALWDKALKEFVVSDGKGSCVRYKAILKRSTLIQQYLDLLGKVSNEEFSKFTDSQKIAFLINAYNAYTITLIVNNYPISSIKKIGGWFSNPWKIEFFNLFRTKRSLDYIEHDVLRKQFKEPGIHFALVCASKGCPPLRSEAYTGEKLNNQLKEAANNFLSDTSKNYVDPKTKTIFVSSIFDWFKADFDIKYGSVKTFINAHIPSVLPESELNTFSLSFLPYNWELNDAKEN